MQRGKLKASAPATPLANGGEGPVPLAPARAQRDLLGVAVEMMPPFYIADLAGNIILANRSYERLAERLLGPAAAMAPKPLFPLDEIIAEIEAGGEAVLRERSFDAAPQLHLRGQHTGILDDRGDLTAVTATFQEVGELAGLRNRLAVAHDRLDDIARLASDWIWETDAELAITFVTPRVTEVLGFQPVELIGRSFLSLGRFTGDAAADGGQPLDPRRRAPFRNLPFTAAHRDGSQRLLHVSSLPVFRGASGEFIGFRGTARDVTEETDAWARVAKSQNQLTQAIEGIPEGFSLFDPDDRLVLCNHKFREAFPQVGHLFTPGITYAEMMLGILAADEVTVPPAEREQWLAKRLALRQQPQVCFEVNLGNGQWIRVSDHKTADGSTVGIRTDITELKQREEALFAAKETAEIASRSKSEFLANISHELRTPLNAIIGFSEIMREEIFGPLGSPQYQEYIGDVLDSAQHLLDVINDILDIAKAEAGKLELFEDEVDLATVVQAARRLVQERAQRAQVEIRTCLAAALPPLVADERKLKQILLNLLTNAVKFTPPGGVVEVATQCAPSGDILLSVADTGIGIAENDIAIALAPFGQVDSALSRKYEGTGLGLPLTNAMIKLHGGELSIESRIGKGTTVTVRLPASRVRAAKPERRT